MGRPAKYPVEFRREAVQLVASSGRPVAEVARSLEISDATLWNWVKADRERTAEDADPDAVSESERAELKRLRKETAQLRIDNEILARQPLFRPRDAPVTGFRFVNDHQAEHSVTDLCRVTGVSRSSFYAWSTRKPSARQRANDELLDKIHEIHERSRRPTGRHGCAANYAATVTGSADTGSPG